MPKKKKQKEKTRLKFKEKGTCPKLEKQVFALFGARKFDAFLDIFFPLLKVISNEQIQSLKCHGM